MILDDRRGRRCEGCKELIEKKRGIDTEYFRYKKKYYHKDCLIEKLNSLKKDKVDNIDLFLKQLDDEEINRRNEADIYWYEKNKLFQWLYDFYDVGGFDTAFYLKVNNMVQGKDYKCKLGITYQELLEMYQKMANYLNKVARNKGIENDNRCYWDLAIVIKDYGKYKEWKEKQKPQINKNIEVDKVNVVKKALERKTGREDVQEENEDDSNDIIF